MTVYLSLGSNLGDREQHLQRAVSLLEERVGQVLRVSDYYYSKPWGFQSAHDFVNCCAAVETPLAPLELLHETQQIEREMGRKKKRENKTDSFQDREIDIDILLYGNQTVDLPTLQIPHPLMQQRDFVMIPLRKILQEKENRTIKAVDGY